MGRSMLRPYEEKGEENPKTQVRTANLAHPQRIRNALVCG